ncbi:hypothetical protein RRG08_024642 [Elysia crispata]|uniref:Uncharacterized protein n=1 Tax=Elysia crispata TaxID=231223 RepID=A0AAE0ZWZ8_9GAST|nr:hypothetical protein RRG08_024642 [Elysia crispata]
MVTIRQAAVKPRTRATTKALAEQVKIRGHSVGGNQRNITWTKPDHGMGLEILTGADQWSSVSADRYLVV